MSSDSTHLMAYLAIFLLVVLFILLFYNRIHLRKERTLLTKIRRETSRMALVLRTGRVSVWTYTLSNRHFKVMGEQGEAIGEYNPVEFSQSYDRDDFERMRSMVFDIVEGRATSGELHMRSNDSDGHTRHYEVYLSIIHRNAKGAIDTLLGIQRDITDEYEKERESKQLLMRHQHVFSSSLVDMIYYDKDGILADINENACKAFNVKDREQLLSERHTLEESPIFSGKESLQSDNTYASSLIDMADIVDDRLQLHERDIHKKMYYESTVNPIRNKRGELEGIYMAGRDVTEMVDSFHHHQQSVRQIQQATRRIQNYIEDINYSLDVSGVRLMSYYPEQHKLQLFRDINTPQLNITQLRCIRLASPRFRRSASSILNRMDHHSKFPISQTLETIFHDEQGRSVWFHINMVPMLNEHGQVTRYFGMARNMTEIVNTEHQLQVETQKARETELLKQSFLTNMSYEIRTPLNTVIGFAEMFEADHDVADEPVFVEEIKKSSNSLLELINDILYLSRLDANMIEYTMADVDFAQIFDSYCQMGWSNVDPNVNTIIENPYNHLIVNIDASNLGTVIEKLCTNATFFTHKGYIRAKCEYRRGELTISIEDTGTGIDKEMLPRVFERFARNSQNEQYGTGLGLPIVQTLVQQMGGTIELQSEPGKGTTAWVSIPCDMKVIDMKRELV